MDKQAANELVKECFENYRYKLFNYCLARLNGERQDADDCVQDAFVVLHRRLLDGEEIQNPRAFLYRSAENFVKQRREANAKSALRSVPLEYAEAIPSAFDDDYLKAVDETDYDLLAEELINTLNSNEKELYNLRYCKKISVDEISKIYNISPTATSMRLLRLRDKVKRLVYEKGGGCNE